MESSRSPVFFFMLTAQTLYFCDMKFPNNFLFLCTSDKYTYTQVWCTQCSHCVYSRCVSIVVGAKTLGRYRTGNYETTLYRRTKLEYKLSKILNRVLASHVWYSVSVASYRERSECECLTTISNSAFTLKPGALYLHSVPYQFCLERNHSEEIDVEIINRFSTNEKTAS